MFDAAMMEFPSKGGESWYSPCPRKFSSFCLCDCSVPLNCYYLTLSSSQKMPKFYVELRGRQFSLEPMPASWPPSYVVTDGKGFSDFVREHDRVGVSFRSLTIEVHERRSSAHAENGKASSHSPVRMFPGAPQLSGKT